MQIQIDSLNITIVKIDHQRMLLVGNSQLPYFMAWDKSKEVWHFTDSTTPFELKILEMEISDFIVNYEQSIS